MNDAMSQRQIDHVIARLSHALRQELYQRREGGAVTGNGVEAAEVSILFERAYGRHV